MISSGLCVEVSRQGLESRPQFSKPPLPSKLGHRAAVRHVTVTVEDVPTFPAASNAFDTMACDPLDKSCVEVEG